MKGSEATDVASGSRPIRHLDALPQTSGGLVNDVDGYERSVHGVTIKSVRTGHGNGPNRVLTSPAGRVELTSVDVGFPMVNRTTVADDQVLLAVIKSAPPAARWSEIDLRSGMVLVYGPEAAHVAVNPPGLSFAFASVQLNAVKEYADGADLCLRPTPWGNVSAVGPEHEAACGHALSSFVERAKASTTPLVDREEAVLRAVATALSAEPSSNPRKMRRGVNRRHVVDTCIEFGEMIGRIPTVIELCRVSHVSERLLRQAFVEEVGMPPTAFFRLWALNRARRRLGTVDPRHTSVSRVAYDVGFNHLSRFASRYAQLFGELPSETLRSTSTGQRDPQLH